MESKECFESSKIELKIWNDTNPSIHGTYIRLTSQAPGGVTSSSCSDLNYLRLIAAIVVVVEVVLQ